MSEALITRSATEALAFAAASCEAQQRLTSEHWKLWSALRHPAYYEMSPQADEWESELGFVPDRSYREYGYMLVEATRTVLACRVLVDRREPGSVVRVEWYPTRLDARKRPN